MPKKSNLQEFITKSRKLHGDKYDYTKSVYVNDSTKVTITCPFHGDYVQTVNSHLRGKGCMACAILTFGKSRYETAKNVFVEKAKKIHGERYDYSKAVYTGAKVEMELICKNHGSFYRHANGHLSGRGCHKCSLEAAKSTTEEFVSRAKEIHSDFYDYSQTVYIKANIKVIIGCPIHGYFKQEPAIHLLNHGCTKCGHKRRGKLHSENPTGWSLSNWKKSAEVSQFFDNFKVYIFKCYNEEEQFYKIGRTYRTSAYRSYDIPYKVEVLHEIKHEDARIIFNLEAQLKREYKNLKYIPKIPFGGMQECFSELPIQQIIANYPTNYIPKTDADPHSYTLD